MTEDKCNKTIKSCQDGMDWLSCDLPKDHHGDCWSDYFK